MPRPNHPSVARSPRLESTPPRDSFAFDREAIADRERFFDHYYGRVYTYVARAVGDPHVAEDLTHDILIKVDGAFDRLDPERDPSAWVFTVAANAIRDHWRRGHTRASRTSVPIDEMIDPPTDGAARVDDAMITAERNARLHRALEGLSDSDRQVLVLRTFHELPTDEVAETLDIRADAVRKRWSRAVHRLGDVYRAMEASEPDAA